MTQSQIDVVTLLFAMEAHHTRQGGQVEVLHDAPSAKAAFMEQLIAEGSVCAYKTRSGRCGLSCFMFRGFTSLGQARYEHLIMKDISNRVSSDSDA